MDELQRNLDNSYDIKNDWKFVSIVQFGIINIFKYS